MTVKSLVLLILGGVLANNYALTQLLGVGPFLGYAKKTSKIVGMGLCVTIVMVLAAAILWPVQTYVLGERLAYMQTVVFLLVIVAIVYVVGLVAAKVLHQPLKAYAPIIALNSAVLGVAINNITAGYTYVESLASALGVGLGFLAAMLALAGVDEKINERHVPAPFRGLPIQLLAASIISMAVMAF